MTQKLIFCLVHVSLNRTYVYMQIIYIHIFHPIQVEVSMYTWKHFRYKLQFRVQVKQSTAVKGGKFNTSQKTGD
jgi:hypothetical protein